MEKGSECPNEKLMRIPTYREIREYVLRVGKEPVTLSKSVSRRGLVKYHTRIDRISGYIARNVLDPLSLLKKTLEVDFYEKIASNALPSGSSARDIVSRLLGKLGVVGKLSREYKSKIAASFDSAEARELYREYVGRVLSIARRLSEHIDQANAAIVELKRTPCIDPSVPVVAVAGLPQVGKSTLVSAVSTAKPRSSPFPFTTKEVIMGHTNVGFRRFQMLDLPGILDRPPEDMNEIERKAFIAVTEVADLILFLVDPSEEFYYGLESQLNLLRSLREWTKADIIVVVNKIDKASAERVGEVSKALSGVLPTAEIVTVSALKGEGLEKLLAVVLGYLDRISK